MSGILIRRIPWALVTLLILSLLVFGGGQLLPGDVGRAVLGPLADPRAVAALDHQLGADRPAPVQYADWAGHLLRGDLGRSFAFRSPVAPFVVAALLNSLKLGGVAFALVVPLGLLGGIAAALNRGRMLDRAIVLFGLSATVVPEFVSGIVLILVFGIGLKLFPISATPPAGAGAGRSFTISSCRRSHSSSSSSATSPAWRGPAPWRRSTATTPARPC